MARILVVEDEPTIAMGLHDDLELDGHDVQVVGDGVTAEAVARERRHDLILLDVMLPRKDGLAVCRTIRAEGIRTPVILLTSKGQELDKVLGLQLGADDYVTKPFSPRELLARIGAVLRRATPVEPPGFVYQRDDLTLDFGRFEATCAGVRVELTALEFKILRALASKRGQVVTHDSVIAEVWGPEVFMSDRVIYTHINNLRQKIEADPANPVRVITVRGIGYRFDW